ncbi:MAG: GAF domain-containing protein [Chloroflexi bacterium]|nr:MAG: GAF domain-containing protein [Chloroflexota bacterium]
MRLNISVAQRLILSFSLMVLLVLLASGIGVWYATTIQRAVDVAQDGVVQVEQVADLQFVWSNVAANVDNMLLTRQVSLNEQALTRELDEFNRQLATLNDNPFGQTPQAVAQNQQISQNLQLLGSQLNQVVTKLVALAKNRRWATAQQLRHTELVSFQRRFDEGLDQLAQNTQSEMAEAVAQAVQAQQRVRTYWFITIALAVVVGVVSSMLSIQSIARPVRTLIQQAQRVTTRDFSSITPLTQQDEIGELSRAFALMTDWLRESYQTLEQRVFERTRRLETVATLSERVNAILHVEDLLVEVVNQTQHNFGYYHVHIYLIDDTRQKLVVAAGTGQAGAEMTAKGHSIAVNASSLVARAARTGQVVWVDDVLETGDWLPNPLLPGTRSEIAAPIVVDGQVVGVLDVQEDEVANFDEGDANLLRSLASQVGVAVRNARLFERVEVALADAHRAQARYMDQAWDRSSIDHQGGKSLYTSPDAPLISPAKQQQFEKFSKQALTQFEPTVVSAEDEAGQALLSPIYLRDKKIGVMQIHSQKQTWSDDDVAIVQAVVDQLAQTADNLRLFEETRNRAGREQTIREITEKMRAATSMEKLVQTAAQELGKRLSAGHAVVELGVDHQKPNSNGRSQNNGKENGRSDE